MSQGNPSGKRYHETDINFNEATYRWLMDVLSPRKLDINATHNELVEAQVKSQLRDIVYFKHNGSAANDPYRD